jgi:predicted ATPase/DNA-binding winged helix-turn-helix (wHTH) protein
MPRCYRFGSFLLDADGRRLRRGDTPVRVTSKAFDLLVLLVECRDRVLSRNEIFDRLWPDTMVEDNNLSQQVHRLRRLLTVDGAGPSAIATLPGRGFRFVAPVEEVASPPTWPAGASGVPAPPDAAVWPTAPDRLIGRDDDAARLHALMRQQHFVTLTGPGGVGKTRLAMEVGWNLRDEINGGVYWIDLTRATRVDDLVPLAAEALGFADAGGRTPLVRLRDWLADHDCLLVFDNFEHILDAGPLLLQLRSPASTIRFLVTSRTVLGLRGEYEFPVPPLRWRQSEGAGIGDEPTRQLPAVQLFLERYRAQASAADADTLDANEISSLCARLDGLPLAIELAAARARLVPPADLLARAKLATFLPNALRDVPERQKSVLRSIEWSYALLSAPAQRALRTLAVFTGGFSAAAGAAVVVAAGPELDETTALDAIETLRQHSLITFDRTGRITRLRVLETVREFCAEVRREAEDRAARDAHARWVLETFDAESASLRSDRHVEAMERLVLDHANLLAALRWAHEQGHATMTAALACAGAAFWHTANLFREGREWIDLAIPDGDERDEAEAAQLTRLLAASALMAFHAGDWSSAQTRVAAVLARPPAGAATALARCLDAGLAAYRGDLAAAEARSRVALDAARAAGEPWLEGLAGLFDGFAAALGGDHEAAYRRLSATPRRIGFLDLLLDVNLALQALLVGRASEAARLFGTRLGARYGTYVPVRQLAAAVEGLAYVADRRGEMRTATLLLSAADRLRSQTAPLSPVWFAEHDRAIDSARRACGDRFDLVWAEGASLSFDETCALAASVAAAAASPAT